MLVCSVRASLCAFAALACGGRLAVGCFFEVGGAALQRKGHAETSTKEAAVGLRKQWTVG
jgi:hypothetical protein